MYSGGIDRAHWPEMGSLKALFFSFPHNSGNADSNIPSYYLKTVFAPILSFYFNHFLTLQQILQIYH